LSFTINPAKGKSDQIARTTRQLHPDSHSA
jgi:hypothetical protein